MIPTLQGNFTPRCKVPSSMLMSQEYFLKVPLIWVNIQFIKQCLKQQNELNTQIIMVLNMLIISYNLMQLDFEQVALNPSYEDLLSSLVKQSQELNPSYMQIEIMNTIINDLQKQIQNFSSSQISQIIATLTMIEYNFYTRTQQQLTVFLEKIRHCRDLMLSSIDPDQALIKRLVGPLSHDYEENKLSSGKVELAMRMMTKIFQNQNPIFQGNRSYIYMAGQGSINFIDTPKWSYDKNPLQDGLTLSFWFTADQCQNDVKMFSFSNKQKMGFEILLKGQKLYYQRLEDQKKFSIIKSKANLVYLCDVSPNVSSFLTIEFEIKKKIFLKNICVINVFYNNMTFNNIEVDIPSGNFKLDLIDIDILTNFKGRVYSLLAASKNLYSLIEELSIPRGFNTENDIRNLTFNFQNQVSKIIYFYTPIRAQQSENNVKVFDVFHKNSAIISKALLKINISIKKDLSYYGGLTNFVSFLIPIETIKDQANVNLFNTFLTMLKAIFMNKPNAQQEILSLHVFGCIRQHLLRTKMHFFDQTTIHLLKQIYVALGTKHIRQEYLKQIIWSLKPSSHLPNKLFLLYSNLIQSFYNEDIQTALSVFDIKEIVGYIIDHIEPRGQCCSEHSLNKITPTEYSEIVKQYFKLIQNILIFKRSDPELSHLMGEIIQIFTLKTSVCFSKVFLDFLQRICSNDEKIEAYFAVQIKPTQIRSIIYMFLANVPCFKIKTLILKLIFRYYVDDKFLNQKSTAFELSICMRISDFQNWKNSTLSHDDKRSHDSSQLGSEAKSTSLTQVVKYLDKARQLPIPEFVNQPKLIDTILEWSFKKPRPQDYPNNGLLLLSDVYKYSAIPQKKYIWNKLSEVLEKSRFDVEVLIWLTQSLLEELVKKESGDKQIISEILNIISQYHIYTIVSEEEHEIALIINTMIRSIFSFRFSRQSSQSAVAAYLKIFNSFIKGCNQFEISRLATLGSIIIKSCYKHLIGYFVSANFDIQGCFEQPEDEDSIVLEILLQTMQNMYILLNALVKGQEQLRQTQKQINSQFQIIGEEHASRNKKILQILFPQASFLFSTSNKVSFMCMIFVTLQSVFEHLDELEIENHKKCLSLVQKFLVLQIQLTENCAGIDNIRHCLEEIKFIYINVLSFIQIKFYQYFYYQVPSGAKANFNFENKLRNNANQMKQFILDVFFTILELLKYIDDMGSKQHKSFYELMKPKKSPKPKLCLLHTQWLKNIDEKIIEFYYISDLRENARQKLAAFLLQRKISRSSTQIQKMITLNMQKFTAQQKTDFLKIEKKSLKSYQDSQRQYYKVSRNFEERMNALMVEHRSKQNLQESKRAHAQEKNKRVAKNSQYNIWEQSRLFQGFWASKEFYKYSQNSKMMNYNLELSNQYKRKRSSKQTLIFTTPFIEIHINHYPIKPSEDVWHQLEDYQPVDDPNSKGKSTKKSEKYFKMGLQFLKRKVIDKILRSSSDKMISEDTYFSDVMINKEMALEPGDMKINKERIEFSYKPISPDIYHLTLIKFKLKQLQLLSDIWKISDITNVKFKKFLLKSNSVELFFKNGESVLLIFFGDNGVAKCAQFTEVLYKLKKAHYVNDELPPQIFWKPIEPSKLIEKVDLTKRWISNEISNFQYLMSLNLLSGRSNHDLNQYPVLPWLFNGYSTFLDSVQNYRDLGKNMGCLGSEDRKQRFKNVYQNVENFKSINHQYHFGFHYSNLPIVIQFLIRIQPYTDAAKQLQGGKFDVADRLFSSIPESYQKSVNQMSDVRQLLPQFFYMPEFLINMEDLKLGVQQNGKKVDNVQLPLGFKTPYEFIQFHRQQLESPYVSENIQKWIDLVFGYKNTGKEAQLNTNKFYYLTYEENVDLNLQDENRTSTQSQMAFFGKTPSQLFSKPHPQKIAQRQKPIHFSKLSRMRIIKQEQEEKSKKSINLQESQQIIHLSYCKLSRRYIVLRKDGKGMIFTLAQNQTSFYSEIVKQFTINLNTYQQMWIRDDRCSTIPSVSILGSSLIIGGCWGGRLMVYNILDDKAELYWKHIDTVSSIARSQTSKIVISCSQNGEAIAWQYTQKMRLEFKNKLVLHYGNINSVIINDHLKIYITGGQDGLVNVIDLFTHKRIRTLKLTESVTSVNAIIYPYYMILICSEKSQQCYSLNGQLLSQQKFEIIGNPVLFKEIQFKDRLLIRVGQEILFVKMPSFEVIYKYELKKGDEKAHNFIIDDNCMLYTVPNTVVCAQRSTNF